MDSKTFNEKLRDGINAYDSEVKFEKLVAEVTKKTGRDITKFSLHLVSRYFHDMLDGREPIQRGAYGYVRTVDDIIDSTIGGVFRTLDEAPPSPFDSYPDELFDYFINAYASGLIKRLTPYVEHEAGVFLMPKKGGKC